MKQKFIPVLFPPLPAKLGHGVPAGQWGNGSVMLHVPCPMPVARHSHRTGLDSLRLSLASSAPLRFLLLGISDTIPEQQQGPPGHQRCAARSAEDLMLPEPQPLGAEGWGAVGKRVSV